MIVAGTGHRPTFCPCKYNEKHPWLLELREKLNKELLDSSFHTIIFGTAIGFDTWIAQEALKVGLNIHAYVPFKGQGSKWPTSSRKIYEELLEKSSKVLYISEDYSNEAFLKRDRAMVDDADHIFSLLSPESTSGGTYYTVQYAKSKNKPITNFWF
jgi:uncharacterized phage-like protein YoqJ